MTPHQKIFALITSIVILLFILELVRKRKIKEEYSWFWLLIGLVIFILVIWYDSLLFVTELIGSETPMTTIFLFGFLFLLFVNIHYSVKISVFTEQIKKMAQKIGILSKEIEDLKNKEKEK